MADGTFQQLYINVHLLGCTKIEEFFFHQESSSFLTHPNHIFVGDNMEQYLSLLDDVRIVCARIRMNKELQHDGFHDMSMNKLVNYLCRADLEANQKLLEAQKVNMEKKEKL